MNTIEKIRAGIERLQKYNHCMADNAINSNMRNFYDGEEDCCKQLLSFLDTLESENPKNLEEEINLWISENENIHHGDKLMVWLLKEVARYFARWGAEHLKK